MFIDETGKFTDEFKSTLPTIVGDEHKDSKIFDDVPDLQTLAKNYANTKTAFGKKLENVIQRPVKDAKPEDIEAFKKSLAVELGAPKEAKEYKFYKDKLPEGQTYNDKAEARIRDIAFKHGVSATAIEEMSKAMFEEQMAEYNTAVAAMVEAENKERESIIGGLKKDWLGDDMPKNLRVILKAIEAFGDDELKKKIADAKLYDNASIDKIEEFEKAGIKLGSLRFLHNVGSKLLSAEFLKGTGGTPAEGSAQEELAKLEKLHHNRPELITAFKKEHGLM